MILPLLLGACAGFLLGWIARPYANPIRCRIPACDRYAARGEGGMCLLHSEQAFLEQMAPGVFCEGACGGFAPPVNAACQRCGTVNLQRRDTVS